MCPCTKVQDLRVQNVYCHCVRWDNYYFPQLCPMDDFRNHVDYMYTYSQTWKFPEQVKSYLVSMYS